VDCLIEFGRTIRITRRTYVKSVVIRLHYCVVQYDSCLKTVKHRKVRRYEGVQVVLLLSLVRIYQGLDYEEN